MSTHVKQAVPFLGVTDMEASLRFYVHGLRFTIKRQSIPEGDKHYPTDEMICGCWLELGDAAIMLQEFMPKARPTDLSEQAHLLLSSVRMLSPSIAISNQAGLEVSQRPSVGNGFWVVLLTDPDGCRIDVSSPAEAPEGRNCRKLDSSDEPPSAFPPLLARV